MEPSNLTSDLVVMRLYEFIQFIDGQTFRMLTHQTQNRLNGTVLLWKFTTIRHDTTSWTSICSTWKGGPLGVWSLLLGKIIDSRQTFRNTTTIANRKADTNNKCINHNSFEAA
jgi:hypothetical protein